MADTRTWEEILSDAIVALNAKDNSQWMLGDLAMEVEASYGSPMIEEFAIKIGVNKETIRRYKVVSKAWPVSWRNEFKSPDGDLCLSHRHFQILAGRENRMELAREAADQGLTCDALTVELMKKDGKYDEKTAVASMSFNKAEVEEILSWLTQIRTMNPASLNETSYKVETKILKFKKKLRTGGEQE